MGWAQRRNKAMAEFYMVTVQVTLQQLEKHGGALGAQPQQEQFELKGSTVNTAQGKGPSPHDAYKDAMEKLGDIATKFLQVGNDGGVVEPPGN